MCGLRLANFDDSHKRSTTLLADWLYRTSPQNWTVNVRSDGYGCLYCAEFRETQITEEIFVHVIWTKIYPTRMKIQKSSTKYHFIPISDICFPQHHFSQISYSLNGIARRCWVTTFIRMGRNDRKCYALRQGMASTIPR